MGGMQATSASEVLVNNTNGLMKAHKEEECFRHTLPGAAKKQPQAAAPTLLKMTCTVE